jgi:hypothetical protein
MSLDIAHIVAELLEERERIDRVISALEDLKRRRDATGNSPKRRGRPPGSRNKPRPGRVGGSLAGGVQKVSFERAAIEQ